MKAIAFILLSTILAISLAVPFNAETFPELKGSAIQVDNTTNLTIHLIPHSHDDMGWLKTVDQYFYNARKDITQDGVQYILDTVTRVLRKDPSKKFVYVEIGFFQRWWNEQNNDTKTAFTTLVNTGQLEFVNGGYVMNDEASVYYEDCIEQMYLGHQFLVQTFNVTPTSGWHLDPFGHASAQSALFAQMGFTAFFVGRIDYQDKDLRVNNTNMSVVWIPNTSQGIENALLGHVLFNRYSNPPGFCFDLLCGDEPIMDDTRLEEYNVDKRANDITAWFRGMQAAYQGNHYLHTAGDDFMYSAAQVDFKNYDKLFAYMNGHYSNYNITVNYSTPSAYLKDIYASNFTYANKTDDFFPYADHINAYWGGYFTSRTSLKGLIRQQGNFLQAVRRLVTQVAWQNTSQYVTNNLEVVDASIYLLEEAVAIGQHHDAATGTSKQAVAEDYKRYFAVGENAVKQAVLFPILQERAQSDLNVTNLQFSTCLLNSTAALCNVTNSSLQANTSVLLAIYNSGITRISIIRVKVPFGNVTVKHTSGANVTSNIVCSNVTDPTDCDLFFSDSFVGFNVTYYYLVPTNTSTAIAGQAIQANVPYNINTFQTISSQDLSSFTLISCLSANNCTTFPFTLNYNYYKSYQDNTNQQKSGAYIFRPTNDTINGSISYSIASTGTVYQGTNFVQITLIGPNITTNLRIYNDISNGVEVQTFVDSINIDDGQGKEVVLVVGASNINNKQTFYTDSMGMELQKRVIDYRPTWNLNASQRAAGNYYPVQSTILINDTTTNASLAVIPDRAQGGASLLNGQVELMIHRRLVLDDARGVDENLNETDADGKGMRQWVTHTLAFYAPGGWFNASYRAIQLNRDVSNIVALAPSNVTFTDIVHDPIGADNFGQIGSYIKLMCRPLSATKYLYRFQNMDETRTRTISNNIFTNSLYGNPTIIETSLTANQAKTDMLAKRYNWSSLNLNNPAYAKTDYLKSTKFSLRPLEIRTFTVEFNQEESAKSAETVEKIEV